MTNEQLQARYEIDFKWRAAWTRLSMKNEPGRLQSRQERIERKAWHANLRIKKLMELFDKLSNSLGINGRPIYSDNNWAHKALLLMDEADILIRHASCCVDEHIYTPAAQSFWSACQLLANERERIHQSEINGESNDSQIGYKDNHNT